MDTSQIDQPHPLSAWVHGTLTIHFDGAVVTHRVSQNDARAVQQMVGKKRSSDDLDWSSTAWFMFESERILFADFKVDEDYGWPLTRDERDRLAKRGHHHGFLRTLVDYWETVGREPSYSLYALAHLLNTALDEDMDAFKAAAKWVEGEQGATRLRDLAKRYRAQADNNAEPDAAEAEADGSAAAAEDDDEPPARVSGDDSDPAGRPTPDDENRKD